MKTILGTALLTVFTLAQTLAQSDPKLPELPAPAGSQAPTPNLPASTSPYDPIPQAFAPSIPQRPISQEETERLKKDENWLVEGMLKKQEEDAAAAALQKKSLELKSKEIESNQPAFKPGDMAGFKPVLPNSSLSSLSMNDKDSTNSKANKKKISDQNTFTPDGIGGGSNPLTTSSAGIVQPILGPRRQILNENVNSLNPGLGIKALPETGIRKLSANTNFVPEGYADSSSQQQSPYQTTAPQAPKPLPPATLTTRPTFKDLKNTIPDPTQVR